MKEICMFKVPEKYRQTMGSKYLVSDGYATTVADGNNGVFVIPYLNNKIQLFCLASDGLDWDHVSVTVIASRRCPTWEEMCYIKSLFWSAEDCVVQYHPPETEYVNVHQYCLHLWKPSKASVPQPPKFMVG